jgi:hypothetical protein
MVVMNGDEKVIKILRASEKNIRYEIHEPGLRN